MKSYSGIKKIKKLKKNKKKFHEQKSSREGILMKFIRHQKKYVRQNYQNSTSV